MKLRSMIFPLGAAALLGACHSGGSGDAGPAPSPGLPPPPVRVELATLVRAGMADAEDVVPRELNGLEVVDTDNPSEFDDWFQ